VESRNIEALGVDIYKLLPIMSFKRGTANFFMEQSISFHNFYQLIYQCKVCSRIFLTSGQIVINVAYFSETITNHKRAKGVIMNIIVRP